jgi:hypothetical protein
MKARIRLALTGCEIDIRNADIQPDADLSTGGVNLRDATMTLTADWGRWLVTEEKP